MPFCIFILKNFVSSLPREIIEAARVDGASHLDIFRKIVLPLSVPAVASLCIFQFVYIWNDLLIGRIFGGSNNLPIIAKLVEVSGSRGQSWHLLTAAAFVSMVAAVDRVLLVAAVLRARACSPAPSKDEQRHRRRRHRSTRRFADARRTGLVAGGCRLLAHGPHRARRHSGDAGQRRSCGCTRHAVRGRAGIGQRSLRHIAGGDVGSLAGRRSRPAVGARGSGQGRAGVAGADGQSASHTHRRSQLRVHERRPVPHRPNRSRVRTRSTGAKVWPRASSTSSATTPSSNATPSIRGSTSAPCARCTWCPSRRP